MQNYIKTILSAFKTWTQKKIKESTADWNENDSSKSNYIKNRTHWEEQDGTIHKLDKKYLDLPTNLATTDDVQEAVDLANEAQNTANTAVTNAATAQSTADTKMDKSDPAGKGSFSMNRKANTTIGPYSHAEGYNNTASGWNSHAEGEYNVASESDAHAEGLQTTASGMASHAEGSGTTASGAYSHAEGEGTVAGGKGSHAGGMYNISDTSTIDRKTGRRKYTHIIGNGTSDTARSNAHTLDWEGNAWYSGDVYVGSTSGTNRDEGSKKLATVEEVQELASQISPQPYVAQTEAPEDKNLLWLDLDDESDDEGLADAIQAAIADVKNVAIPAPEVAEVGQTVVVKEVDESGKPVAWEAVNLPSGDSVPEKVEFTLIGEGTLVPTETVAAIDTGVTWADVKDFDWFEIGIESNAGITGQKYWFYNRDYIPEAWRRFFLCGDRLGRSRFKKIADGVYEWFSAWGAVNTSGVTGNTADYANEFPVLNGPSAYLIRFNWADTDKFYIYPSVAIPENGTHKYKIMGIKFK